MLSFTSRSPSESRAEVASSKIRILGFFNTALAIAILYFYPPDKLALFSKILVRIPSGNYLLFSKKPKLAILMAESS